MNKIMLVIGLFVFGQFQCAAQSVTRLGLTDVIEKARNQSPASKQAETRKKNRYWQYKLYKSNYNPQLALSGNVPGYNRDFLSNRIDDGTILFQDREQLSSNLNLGLNQPIGLTGGSVSINSGVNYFSDLNQDLTRYSSTLFNIQLNQPIFGFNDLKWDKRTEPLRYEESLRSYVEEMELVSREAASFFFNFLDAQINYEIAEFNQLNNDTIFKIEEGRYNIGTTSKDKLLQVELQLLRSQQDVVQAQLDLETASQQLRAYLGLQTNDTLKLTIPETVPEFDIPIQEAITFAKLNRADYLAFERRRLEAEREVSQARAQRVEANLVASFGLNNAADQFQDVSNNPNNQQRFDLSLVVPILDWGRNKARIETALANKELNDYVIDQDIQNFEQEILTLVRRFQVLRSQLKISKKSDQVADERYRVAQNRYLTGKVDITNLNIALTEKDQAKRSYVNSLRDFWVAYFDLRRLTLYDFANNQLLYDSSK
ncbi:MAG: TolC family protein [Cryomorphaceae bacterium]|nr:TolC family protein [Flavobacteriales bacterium]